MIINRYNYETYFLLYIDKELSVEEMQAVEAFVAGHPDLAAELELLQQSVIRPEKQLVFADKASLMKSAVNKDLINDRNYEEYFVLYADDELTEQEKAAVTSYLHAHPERQKEMELLQRVKLQPEELECDFKAGLYRKEKERKVNPFRWSIAAAAAVLLLAGWFWINNDAPSSENGTAQVDARRKA
jgi:anti-sigma factor RsiW